MGISHSWNGTVLTITSDSGTSSADLKGDIGVRGPQGATGIVDYDLVYTKNDPPTAEEVNAAPSGCGYGDIVPRIEADANNPLKDQVNTLVAGWASKTAKQYQIYDATFMGTTILATIFKFNSSTVIISGVAMNGYKVQKVRGGNGWTDWEWENPPMYENTEYRTTEKWQGKAVYVMCINIGDMPNATTKNYPISLPRTNDIRYSGTMKRKDGSGMGLSFPYRMGSTEQVDVCIANTAIYITSNIDLSAWNGYLTLWYTKE